MDVDDRNVVETFPACTISEALTSYLDITSPMSPNMLQCLSKETSYKSLRQRLETLAIVMKYLYRQCRY